MKTLIHLHADCSGCCHFPGCRTHIISPVRMNLTFTRQRKRSERRTAFPAVCVCAPTACVCTCTVLCKRHTKDHPFVLSQMATQHLLVIIWWQTILMGKCNIYSFHFPLQSCGTYLSRFMIIVSITNKKKIKIKNKTIN